MKKALVALLAFSLTSCCCEDYVKADRDTYNLLEADVLYGIENNPENTEEVKADKKMLVDSWKFRINAALKDMR